jgi:hypothetical protein
MLIENIGTLLKTSGENEDISIIISLGSVECEMMSYRISIRDIKS